MSSTHEREIHKIYLGKREGKHPIRRRKNWWEDNIKMDLEKREWEGADWHPQACNRN